MPVRPLILPVLAVLAASWLAAPASAEQPANTIVGTWERVLHCQDLVRAEIAAGFPEVAPEAAAEFVHVTPDGVADPEHPCRGALPHRHSHFFTPDGQFGSLDEFGNQVDWGVYEVIGDDTLVMPYNFEDGTEILVTFHFRIRGNTIAFDPVIPSDCSTDYCREATSWGVSVAAGGKTWRRVE